MKSKTILFGGSGFFGPSILERNPDMISVGRSRPPSYVGNEHIKVTDFSDLSALDEVKFDRVIFLVGSTDYARINSDPVLGIDSNVLQFKKILPYMEKRKIKKLVCFSSILLYDSKKIAIPVNENQPINPYSSEYAFSKFLLEETAKFYSKRIPIVTVRLSNIYGPTKLVKSDVITNLIQQSLSPSVPVVENAEVVRDFIFSYDAADAILKLSETDFEGTINVGTGTGHSVSEAVKIVEKLSGKKVKILNNPATGHPKFVCDISKLSKLTRWKPKFTLEEGVEETYKRMSQWADECRWWEKRS